jgi:methionine aminopeptidase
MIQLKSRRDRDYAEGEPHRRRDSGRGAASAAGVTTGDLEHRGRSVRAGLPAFKAKVAGQVYPRAICISVNDGSSTNSIRQSALGRGDIVGLNGVNYRVFW